MLTKKNIGIALFGLFLLTSCSEEKPGDAFLKYANKALTGNFDGLADGFCRNGQVLTTQQDSVNRVLMKHYQQYLERKYGGLKSVEIVRDSIYADGQKADVRVRLHFKNDLSEETEYVMSQVDGKWKIDLDL